MMITPDTTVEFRSISELPRVTPIDAAAGGAWDAYVGRHADTTLCHTSAWMRAVQQTWGHTPHHLAARRDNRTVGVLPLFHVRSRLFGSMLVSTPNAVYGGAIGDDAAARLALASAAARRARDLKVDYLELRNHAEVPEINAHDWHTHDLYVTFRHPLQADEDALSRTVNRDIRRLVRNAVKNGLSAEVGGAELVNEFYEVYATSVRNLGTPVFPKRLFANFLKEFAGASDILLVRQGQRVAAGVLSFYFRDTVLPYYGGAYGEFQKCGVNNLMYWELMKHAAQHGFTWFDFGRSKVGSGAWHFKRGWSMQEVPLPYRVRLVRAAKIPALNPTNPKFALSIAAWKRLPVSVTKWIGPAVVRNLP